MSSIVYTVAQIGETALLKPGDYEVLVFRDRSGQSPYLQWLDSLPWKTQERILSRVAAGSSVISRRSVRDYTNSACSSARATEFISGSTKER